MKVTKRKNELFPDLVVYSGFTTHYNCGIIEKTEFISSNNSITFYPKNEESFVTVPEATVIDLPYVAHYGITLSEDGSRFFVQNFEKGLYCFETRTGTMVWHNKRKKPGHLIVKGEIIICCFGKEVCVLSFLSGEVISQYPLGSSARFYPITDNMFMVGPKKGKYLILDGQFNEVHKFSIALVNPDNLDTCIIRDVDFGADMLIVSGVAYASTSFIQAKSTNSLDKMIQDSRFTRHIKIPRAVMALR